MVEWKECYIENLFHYASICMTVFVWQCLYGSV